ncbi:MAG: ABC-type transport auxiliary lipoprotein family protein [Luteimonas sp.]
MSAVATALVIVVLLLGGCSLLGKKTTATIYAPDARMQADPAWPSVQWQLSLSRPSAARMLDSQRIAVRPVPGELQVYKDAGWAKTPTDQVLDTVLRGLEDSGRIPAVARQGSGIAADYKLVMDLRRFEADYAGAAVPAATIELNVKLLHAPEHDVVDARTFLQAVPATSADVAAVSQAFEQALGRIGHDVTGWTLTTGEAHERGGAQHKPSKRQGRSE